MLDLTICIAFYERDIDYIERLANYCAIRFPVILWDDRADKSVELKFNEGVRVLNSDSTNKAYIFQARRNLALAVETEFLWFVDSDDFPLINNVREEYCKCDINTFLFRWYSSKTDYYIHVYEDEYEIFDGNPLEIKECGAVWNRIFRTSKVKEAFSILPDGVKLSCDDDHLINTAIRIVSKSYSNHAVVIYDFHAYKSHSCREDYTNNVDQLESVINGLGESIRIKSTLLDSDSLRETARFDKFASTRFYIENASTSKIKEERMAMYKKIGEELGPDLLKEYVANKFFDISWEFLEATNTFNDGPVVVSTYVDEDGVTRETKQHCKRTGENDFEWELLDE